MSFIIGYCTLILICHAMADGVVEQDCNLALQSSDTGRLPSI